MSSIPVISVVIPTYNRANDLKRALKSVQVQTFTNWEVLIVDNHSVDNTDQVVSDFNDSRIKLFKIHNNGVIAASRNVGIREASGAYIAFLDSDDWWKPEKLRLSLDTLNAGADLVYHDLFLVTKTDQRLFLKKVTTRGLTRPVFDNLLTNGNCIINSSVVVKKILLTSIGGISEDYDLIAAEDYDCWLRIAKLTDKFTRIPKSLGYYWAGGGNISNPERTIENADAIELRYLDNKCTGNNGSANWIQYSRGRAYYLMRNWELAKKHLSNIGWLGTPFSMYIKSQWMLQFIRWAHENKP
jgi:glycosyltransferase involved in cell wall biosynthesis